MHVNRISQRVKNHVVWRREFAKRANEYTHTHIHSHCRKWQKKRHKLTESKPNASISYYLAFWSTNRCPWLKWCVWIKLLKWMHAVWLVRCVCISHAFDLGCSWKIPFWFRFHANAATFNGLSIRTQFDKLPFFRGVVAPSRTKKVCVFESTYAAAAVL